MGNGDKRLTGVPGIGRQAAQRLARDELAKAIYHPHQSVLQWLLSHAERLLDRLRGGAAVSRAAGGHWSRWPPWSCWSWPSSCAGSVRSPGPGAPGPGGWPEILS